MYSRMSRRIGLLLLFMVCSLSVTLSGQVILTPAEKVNFEQHSPYDEMMTYLQEIQASSTEMLLTSFGTTVEGRDQPYAIFSRPLITQPWEAHASGKPIVVLAANVHGGERSIRDALLILTRELVSPGHPMNDLLDDMVIVLAPTINPDGFVHGSRTNSLGIDMNRDYIKLEQPSVRNFVQNILHTWHPHVILDGHNGGRYPYNQTYQGPPNAASDQRLTDLCDNEIFPFINSQMEKNGYKSWYYYGSDRDNRVTGMPTQLRLNTGYGGAMNSVTILFETPGGQEIETAVKSGLVATKAVVEFVAAHKAKVLDLVHTARRETIEMGQNATGMIPVQMTVGPKPYKVTYERAKPVEGQEGQPRQRGSTPREIETVVDAELMFEPVATKVRPRPYAYVLEPRAYKAVELLLRHNITVEVLQQETELDVEAYNMTDVEYTPEYDHPASVNVTFADETIQERRTFPKGSYVIRTGQVMGRLVTHLLEPETDDNVVKWNTMNALIPRAPRGRRGPGGDQPSPQETEEPQPLIFPIFKVMQPTTMGTTIFKK
jgi:hypothetical protein